ncbi:MAG: hypothetical protein U0412_09665 [Nitrospira sp.]
MKIFSVAILAAILGYVVGLFGMMARLNSSRPTSTTNLLEWR